MQIRLNGQPKELDAPVTVAQLVADEGFRPELIAVEINYEILPKDKYKTTQIQEGDSIEVVSFMGGG